MTSFVFPLVAWNEPPQAPIVKAIASENGQTVVAPMANGQIWCMSFTITEDGPKLLPKTLLIGHRVAISAMILCRIDVDGPAREENIIVSGSEDGEIIMWDLMDGRALQANPDAFPGVPTSICLSTSRKYIIVGGRNDTLLVLDASTLEVLRSVNVLGDWIYTLCSQPTEFKELDELLAVTPQNSIVSLQFDESNQSITEPETKISVPLGDTPTRNAGFNPHNSKVFVVLDRKACRVFWRDPDFRSLCAIDSPKASRGWRGYYCLSSFSVLLWSMEGMSYLYCYADPASVKRDQIENIPSDATFLFSNLHEAFYVSTQDSSSPQERLPTLIATFDTGETFGMTAMCVLPTKSNPSNLHYIVRFHHTDNKLSIFIWACADRRIQPPLSPKLSSVQLNPNVHVEPLSNIKFDDLWAIKEKERFGITSATIVSEKVGAIGLSNGLICIIPLSAPFFVSLNDLESKSLMILSGHVGPVTALLVLESSRSKSILVSGGADSTIRIWNYESGELLYSNPCHSDHVVGLYNVPKASQSKENCSVLSVCQSNSIAITDVDENRLLHSFTGHIFPVAAMYWQLANELLIVQTASEDTTIYVWQVKTGHLDRVEVGESAEEIIHSCDQKLLIHAPKVDYMSTTIRQSLSIFPVFAGANNMPLLFVLSVNLKRLINDIYGGQHGIKIGVTQAAPTSATGSVESSPSRLEEQKPDTRKMDDQRSESRTRTESETSSRSLSPSKVSKLGANINELFKKASRSRQASNASDSPQKSPDKEKSATDSSADLQLAKKSISSTSLDVIDQSGNFVTPDSNVIQGLFSALLSWGYNENIDQICSGTLDLSPSRKYVTTGLRGANGYLSVLAPTIQGTHSDWKISSTFTACRLLQILALGRSAWAKKGVDDDLKRVMNFYGHGLAPIVGNKFAFPSFSFLAKYWQDQIADVQWAARSIFSSALSNLSADERRSLVDYWHQHLPNATMKKPSKTNIRATIILGIIGSESPALLVDKKCKDVAEALDMLLKEDAKGPYRSIGIELIARGFTIWEPFLNSSAVVRTIISTTGLTAPSSGGSPLKEGSAPPDTTSGLSPSLIMTSRQAIVQIATLNPGLFISTVTLDVGHAKLAQERIGALKLLGMFISKKPMLILNHLSKVIEAMVKCLDPNVPAMREALQPIITANFAELIKLYPNVSFHGGTQKLAVGTAEGVVVVYDVKIATRVQILEGHTKGVTAVSYSPDGKLIVTYSLEENCVRVWQSTTTFLSGLVGTFGAPNSPSLSGGQMKSFREFNVGPPNSLENVNILKDVKLAWASDRSVKLFSVNDTQLVFTV